jgi:DNA repair protein RadD
MKQLRPYQSNVIERLRARVREGFRRILLVAPTGCGKTEISGALVASARANYSARILFFAHRLELVDQPVKRFAEWGVTEVGVIRADDHRTNAMMPVQVATVQSLSRRDLPLADIVIVDEAHRTAGNSYRKILAAYPDATIIGLTATPCRLDGKPLGDVYDCLEIVESYSSLIKLGFIAEPTVYSTRVPVDLSDVHTRRGDFIDEEVEEVMIAPQIVGNVVEEWLAHSERRRTVVYAVTINHSKTMVAKFVEAGVKAEHLDGETPLDERAAILARLASGETELVSNCQVLTEGWDSPSVKCIVMARPTKSLALFMQCVGRGLRPWNDVRPIVIDCGQNVDRHGLPHEDRQWSLTTEAKRDPGKKYRMCPACFAYVSKNPCELCGHAPPVQHREVREDLSAKLVTRSQNDLDPRRVFYLAQVSRAQSMGFKPGFAAAKFKEKFEQWPPWAWSQETKKIFADDRDWQDKQVKRERERAYWQEKNAEKTTNEEIVETHDEVNAFDDLLR